MENDLDKIVSKIKKLLTLSDKNTNESEAKAALLKAQKLMKQYKVEVTDRVEEKHKYGRSYGTHKYDYFFRKPLATVLAKNFCCKSYTASGRMMFVGREEDIKVCCTAFNYAYEYIMRQATKRYNEAYARGHDTKGVFNSYAMGFISGMKKVLDEQCVALMLVMPEDVKQKIEEFEKAAKVKEGKPRAQTINPASYLVGYKDGEEYSRETKRLTA